MTDPLLQESTEDAQPVRRSTRSQVMRIGGIIVLAAFLAGGVTGLRWWSHPTLLQSGPVSGFAAAAKPLETATMYATVALPPDDADHSERITFTGARAHYSRTSIPVTSTFAICITRKGSMGVSNTETPQQFCDHVRPLRKGSVFDYSHSHLQEIVLTIRPHHAGSATLTSVDLSYTRTWGHLGQRGTQHLSEYFKLTAN